MKKKITILKNGMKKKNYNTEKWNEKKREKKIQY